MLVSCAFHFAPPSAYRARLERNLAYGRVQHMNFAKHDARLIMIRLDGKMHIKAFSQSLNLCFALFLVICDRFSFSAFAFHDATNAFRFTTSILLPSRDENDIVMTSA